MFRFLQNTRLSLFVLLLVATFYSDLRAQAEPDVVVKTPEVEPKFQGPTSYRYEEEVPILKRVIKKKKKKKEKFKGYGKEKKLFNELCMALFDDGRAMPVSKIGEKFKGGAPDCIACKSFFRLFFTYCKKEPAHIRKAKQENKIQLAKQARMKKEMGDDFEQSGVEIVKPYTPPKPQLELSLLVLDLSSRIFNGLADDTKKIHKHYEAVELFVEKLRETEKRTPAEILLF